MKIVLGLIFALLSLNFIGAQSDLDELLSDLKNHPKDSNKVLLLHDIATEYRYSDAKTGVNYGIKGLKLAVELDFHRGEFIMNNVLGQLYTSTSAYDSAEFHLQNSLTISEEYTFNPNVTYNALGNLAFYKSDFEVALDWYLKTLENAKERNDSSTISKSYGNIGNVYYYLGDIPKVKQNFSKSLDLKIALNDSAGIAHTMGNMGNLYMDEGDLDSAFYYFNSSKIIFERQNNIYGVSLCLTSLADIYTNQGKLTEAQKALEASILLAEQVGDVHAVMRNYHQLAAIYYKEGKNSLAVSTYVTAIAKAKEINSKTYIRDGYLNLYKIQEAMGDYKNALESHKHFYDWNDSIYNEKKNEALATLTAEFKTKEIADSLHISQQNEEIAEIKANKAEEESFRKTRQLWIISFILLILLLLIVLVFINYKAKKKANALLALKNTEISNQKAIIEEKHSEITDSINYARRIQNAILPPHKLIQNALPESFVLYKPKDVVAGDFYWFQEQGKAVYIAAADCTGHGVPGALVSVVCNNGLNRSVREYGLNDPGEILNKTRELVIQEFEKSEEEVKDGMDIALCKIENNILHFAGANNPVWIIRKEISSDEEAELSTKIGEALKIEPGNKNYCIEIKADKQPIGKYANSTPYRTHEIELKKGDLIYLFSDGFADQFGGEKGKKLKYKPFRNMLLELSDLNVSKQKETLDKAFEKWRGEFEQVDDVCVIGIKI